MLLDILLLLLITSVVLAGLWIGYQLSRMVDKVSAIERHNRYIWAHLLRTIGTKVPEGPEKVS